MSLFFTSTKFAKISRTAKKSRASKSHILPKFVHQEPVLKQEPPENNEASTFEVVTFLPNAEGELRDIPGFGQVLETRSLQDGRVERYPISTLGMIQFFKNDTSLIVRYRI